MEKKQGIDWSALAPASSSSFPGLNPEAANIIMRNVDLKYPEDALPLTDPTMTINPLALPHAEPASMARACGIDNSNLEHEFVRAGHLKNDDLPMTHSPNVLESFPKAMNACGSVDVVPTKPLKEGEGAVTEGRIAQCHRCPDLSYKVRGR